MGARRQAYWDRPGTFGWWAGYLSDAVRIYYSATPSSQMPWCKLMPTDDPRYVFVGGGAATAPVVHGGSQDSHIARRDCLKHAGRTKGLAGHT